MNDSLFTTIGSMSFIQQRGQTELSHTSASKKELCELFEKNQLSEENARQWLEDIRPDPEDVPVDPWTKWA